MPAVLKEAMEGQPLNALGPSVTFNEGLGYVGARDLIISLSHSFKYLRSLQCEQVCLKMLVMSEAPSVAHSQHILSGDRECHSPTFSYSHAFLH